MSVLSRHIIKQNKQKFDRTHRKFGTVEYANYFLLPIISPYQY